MFEVVWGCWDDSVAMAATKLVAGFSCQGRQVARHDGRKVATLQRYRDAVVVHTLQAQGHVLEHPIGSQQQRDLAFPCAWDNGAVQ
jgi:hypothetical protein